MFGRRPTGKRSNPEATRFFFAWRKHPWNYANLQRDSFLRFASSAKAPRPARICAYLQIVVKYYRLCGGEGGIRTPEALSSLHAFQACALNRARPPLRTRTRLCITPTRGATDALDRPVLARLKKSSGASRTDRSLLENVSMLHTPICDYFGIKYPILLAGMGGVAMHKLVAAVSNAGGLGVIG